MPISRRSAAAPLKPGAASIDITIIESGAPLGGVGEPALPPVAPALVNAWATLGSGPRRTLPLFPQAVPATA